MNPVFMLAYNNLEMTKAAVDSVLAQDIPVDLYLVNNGSTDATQGWADGMAALFPNIHVTHLENNISPVKIANELLANLIRCDYALLLANDLVLPPDFYRELLRWPRGIVCGSEVRSLPLPDMQPYSAVSENTPMSAMLLRRWCYEAVIARDGYFFDEGMFHYASDCDLALRIASCGIRGVQINVPYLHHSSATIKTATPEVQAAMHSQADADRLYFFKKWAFAVDAYEYGRCAVDINFRGERVDV